MQFLYKTASGLATALVSTTLGIFGYKENAPVGFVQPDAALVAIRVVIGLIPGIIFILSIIFCYRANMSREKFDAVKAELAKRKEQKENA